jgi:hypothetical protein
LPGIADGGDLGCDEADVGGETFHRRFAHVGRERGFEARALELEHANQPVELLLAPFDWACTAAVVGVAHVGDDASDIDSCEVEVGAFRAISNSHTRKDAS